MLPVIITNHKTYYISYYIKIYRLNYIGVLYDRNKQSAPASAVVELG